MYNLMGNGKTPGKTPRRKEKLQPVANLAKDPVKVYCRLRPLKDLNLESCVEILSPSTLALVPPNSSNDSDSRIVQYSFENIFSSHTDQKTIFDHIAFPLLQGLLTGKNGLLFTYGVTGSGKTYTLNGEKNNPGILPRCVSILFNTIKNKQSGKYLIKPDKMNGFEVQSESEAVSDRKWEKRSQTMKTPKRSDSQSYKYNNDGTIVTGINDDHIYAVFVTYIEVYNNQVYDLLDDGGGRILQAKLVREDSERNMYVNGVREIEVKSAEETFEQILIGQKRKRMAQTALNADSSRSHSIFNIRVVQLAAVARNSQGDAVIPEKNLLTVGQLSLVDLAGSERCSRTQNTGIRLKEASSINNSLMTLRACLEALRENQIYGLSKIVPYRESKLTLLFKNFFEGDGAVRMIVCVNPSALDYDENVQVMRFAQMTQDVQVARPEIRHMPYRKTPKPPSRVLSAKSSGSTLTSAVNSCPSLILPPIPPIVINLNELDTMSIKNVIQALQTRTSMYDEMDYEKEKNAFRQRLVDLSQTDISREMELQNYKILLKTEKKNAKTMAANISESEAERNRLMVELQNRDKQIKDMREALRERDLKLTHTVFEKERSKQKFQAHTEKMSQELENKLKRQRAKLESERKGDLAKLKLIEKVLDNQIPVKINGEEDENENMVPVEKPIIKPVASCSAIKDTPVLKRPVPVANKRNRRSRSVGELWLEHTQKNAVPLGTLMQPTMKRRKSVTKLNKAEDITNPRQNKYCLMDQQADNDGEIETRLYKADIIPTCGGGAQVIFNDVECLTQRSPTDTPVKTPRKPFHANSEQQDAKRRRV